MPIVIFALMMDGRRKRSKQMKYKVGDKVRVRKDLERMKVYGGKLSDDFMTFFRGRIVTIVEDNCVGDVYRIKEDGERCSWTDEMFEGLANEAPSITKRINDKSDAINGLANTDAIKPDYYERSAMQPLEVMQRIMTAEQFEGFLLGNCIKYRMRCENKGQRDSDMYKARQYAYWLEMTKEGRIINPSEDKVPFDYEFRVV